MIDRSFQQVCRPRGGKWALNAFKSARDLWRHSSIAFRDGVYTACIPAHGVLMLRVYSKN
jgi:hypothetical protein